MVGRSRSFDFTGSNIGASSIPFSARGEKLNIPSFFLGAVLTSWVGHEELDLAESTAGAEATRTGSGLTFVSGFTFVTAGFVLGAFVTLVVVFGFELPKNESKSLSTVEVFWSAKSNSPKLELVFETVCVSGAVFGVELLLRWPNGLFRVFSVVDLAILLTSSRIPVLATVFFLVSQENGSGSDEVRLTGLVALAFSESAEGFTSVEARSAVA